MRRGALFAVLPAVASLAAGLLLAQSSSSRSSQDAAVLRVAKAGRTAVLKDRPRTMCRLLTRRARRNSLKDGNYVDRRARQKRPGPNTCETAIAFLLDQERRYNREYRRVQRQPSLATFTVVRIAGNRARVHLSIPTVDGYSNDGDIYFLKGRHGWRADFANFSPFDGSSGR